MSKNSWIMASIQQPPSEQTVEVRRIGEKTTYRISYDKERVLDDKLEWKFPETDSLWNPGSKPPNHFNEVIVRAKNRSNDYTYAIGEQAIVNLEQGRKKYWHIHGHKMGLDNAPDLEWMEIPK